MTKKTSKAYDFVTQDPQTNMMVEVKIVRYCPTGAEYEVPLSPQLISRMAELKFKHKLIQYLSKQ